MSSAHLPRALAGAAIVAAAALALAQPTSTGPLEPPTNGMSRADPMWHALVNATVHAAPGQTLEHATVVIRDGVIVSVQAAPVGPGDATLPKSPAPPAGARVWDCRGLHVYPAFIDPFIDVDAPRPAKDDPARHWNGAITPQRRALDGPGLPDSAAKELRDMGFAAAAISPRGGLIRGTSAVVSLAKRDDDPSSPKPPVYASDTFLTMSFDATGRAESTAWENYPGSQMGAISLIRQTLLDADWQAAERAAGRHNATPAALDALWRWRTPGSPPDALPAAFSIPSDASAPPSMPIVFDTEDELEVFRARKIADEFGRTFIILGSGQEYQRLAALTGPPATTKKDAARADDQRIWILPLNFPEAPKISSIAEADALELREMMIWEQSPTNPRRLLAAGQIVSLTTSKLRKRSSFWENLRTAIRHGLSTDDAFAMVTTRPASLLNLGDRLGTIAPGKIANLTVTDGDWFDPDARSEADASKKPRIRDVWIDGVRHEISPPPGLTLTGVWDLDFDPAPPDVARGAMRVTFTFDDENKLTITKYTRTDDEPGSEPKIREEKAKAKEQKLEKNRLSFTFEHEPLGEPGVFINQALVEGSEIRGEFIRSSGVRMKFIARKRDEPKAIGEWRVIEFDGTPKNPADPDGLRMSVTRDAVTLLFTDAAGNRTRIKADDVKIGRDTKMEMENAGRAPAPPEESPAPHAPDLSFTHSLEKLGGKGKSSDTLRLDPNDPNLLLGEGELPKQGDDPASRHTYKARRLTHAEIAQERAEERARRRSVAGVWRMSLVDDSADRISAAGASKPTEILITRDGSITVRSFDADGAPLDVLAMNARVSDAEIAYDIDTSPPGSKGAGIAKPVIAKVRATRFNDLLIGSMSFPSGPRTALNPEGLVERTFSAARIALAGEPRDEEDDDRDQSLLAIASVPETIVYPFGPYGTIRPPDPQSVVVRNATIWTSGPRGIIRDATLVVSDGKIQDVLDAGVEPKIQSGTLVIDARGKHVTPGIIDCHSHTGISRGVNEFGQSVTAEVRIADVTNPDSISWYRQLAGGVTAVNNLHGSANAIGGQSQVNKNRWGALHPDDLHFDGAIGGIKFALGENPKGGNSDRATARYPRSRMGVETIIRDRFTAAREYIARRDTPGFRRDLELEALAEILEGKRLVHCHSYRQDEILMLCRVAEEFGFTIGTFQHILEGYKVADEIAKRSLGGSAFSDWWAFKVEVQDAIPQGGPIMHEQGVVVSFNSDSDEMARRMNVEAAKAVKYSVGPDGKPTISPDEAFKFVTLNPAKQLKIDDRVGSLEPGKDADFVIWSGDPLSTFSKAEQTWIDGRCYWSLDKDTDARTRIADERARLTQKILGGLTRNKSPKPKSTEKSADGKSDEKKTETNTPDPAPPKSRDDLESMRGFSTATADDVADPSAFDSASSFPPSHAPPSWWLRRYYLDRYERGLPIDASIPGECGCMDTFARW